MTFVLNPKLTRDMILSLRSASKTFLRITNEGVHVSIPLPSPSVLIIIRIDSFVINRSTVCFVGSADHFLLVVVLENLNPSPLVKMILGPHNYWY